MMDKVQKVSNCINMNISSSQTLPITSLNSINQLAIDIHCVFLEVGNEFLNIIQMNFGSQNIGITVCN
jgi:hypothetical protein